MTPADYSRLPRRARTRRAASSRSSSASWSSCSGNRNAVYLEPFRHEPERFARLDAVLHEPSLYDRVVRLLARRGLPVDPALLERDWSVSYSRDRVVLAGVAGRLPGARDPLGPLRAGRGAVRPGGRHAPVAAPPRHDGRAHHRAEGGHGRDGRRAVPAGAAAAGAVPGAVAGEDAALVAATDRRADLLGPAGAEELAGARGGRSGPAAATGSWCPRASRTWPATRSDCSPAPRGRRSRTCSPPGPRRPSPPTSRATTRGRRTTRPCARPWPLSSVPGPARPSS